MRIRGCGNAGRWLSKQLTRALAGFSVVLAVAVPLRAKAAGPQDVFVEWGSNAIGQSVTPPNVRDGTVVAWGDNSQGQTTVPTWLSGVTAIAVQVR